MVLIALIIAIGIKLSGIDDISWTAIVLIFIVWLQRGKDWTDINHAIQMLSASSLNTKESIEEKIENLIKENERLERELDRKQDKPPIHDDWDD